MMEYSVRIVVAARTFSNESSRACIVSALDRDEDLENTSVMEVDRCTEEQNTIGGNYRERGN